MRVMLTALVGALWCASVPAKALDLVEDLKTLHTMCEQHKNNQRCANDAEQLRMLLGQLVRLRLGVVIRNHETQEERVLAEDIIARRNEIVARWQ